MKMYVSIWLPLEEFSFSTVTMATITMVTVVFLRVFSNTAVMLDLRNLMLGKGIEGSYRKLYLWSDDNNRNVDFQVIFFCLLYI